MAIDAFRVALLSGAVNDEIFDAGQASWDDSDSLAAWDGDRCVGHVAAFRFDSTVPGGALVPTAGVTRVGVLPTHTRRGLLTQHDASPPRRLARARQRAGDAPRQRDLDLPALRLRTGHRLDCRCRHASGRTGPGGSRRRSGSMRLLDRREVLDVVPLLYERDRPLAHRLDQPSAVVVEAGTEGRQSAHRHSLRQGLVRRRAHRRRRQRRRLRALRRRLGRVVRHEPGRRRQGPRSVGFIDRGRGRAVAISRSTSI